MRAARILGFILAACGTMWPAAGPVPQFQDREEYNLVGAIQLQSDPARRLVLLEQWEKSYPASSFRQERWNQFIRTYRALGHPRKMRDVARRMAADNPSGFGNYWLTVLTINLQDTSPRALEEGERAAAAVLRNAPQNFSAANCPSSVALPDWNHERDRQTELAHRALGWVELQQKRYVEAAAELTQVIRSNPSDAEACFWLGSAILGEQTPDAQSKALYYFGRSLALSGKSALVPEAKRLVQPYFQRAYVAVNGSNQGMEEFLQQAGGALRRE